MHYKLLADKYLRLGRNASYQGEHVGRLLRGTDAARCFPEVKHEQGEKVASPWLGSCSDGCVGALSSPKKSCSGEVSDTESTTALVLKSSVIFSA